MVDFRPFRGVRYDTSLAGPMQDLVCPPYDVNSAAGERTLLERSPHNMVRLELAELSGPAAAGRYETAARAYEAMLVDGVLVRDESPGYYLVRQRFEDGGTVMERLGLFGALRLEELGSGVLPHEDTAAGPKEDRLALMDAAAANFSPLMMLYRDPRGVVARTIAETMAAPPAVEFDVDGQGYAMWRIDSNEATAAIARALGTQPAYIADGHHRYETALVYRDARRAHAGTGDEAADYVLTCLIAFDDPGLVIQPYYRVVHGLAADELGRLRELLQALFAARPLGANAVQPGALDRAVAEAGRGRVALGVFEAGKKPEVLMPSSDLVPNADPALPPEARAKAVEAFVLQELLFRPVMGDAFPAHVAYVHDPAEAMDMVERGDGQMAFFIKGVPSDVFESVVGAGIRLPRKSTYFSPKLPSGLVINPLAGPL